MENRDFGSQFSMVLNGQTILFHKNTKSKTVKDNCHAHVAIILTTYNVINLLSYCHTRISI